MPRRAWPSQRWCCRAQGRFPRTFRRRVVMACCFTLRLPHDCPSLQDRLSTGSRATFGGSDVAAVVWPPQSRRRAGRVRVGKYETSRKASQWAVAVVGRSVAAATVPHLCPMSSTHVIHAAVAHGTRRPMPVRARRSGWWGMIGWRAAWPPPSLVRYVSAHGCDRCFY